MLTKLIINNVVLIDKLEINFKKGLVVFSGETGAGKSILLEALGLAIGRRAEVRLVGYKNNLARVSAEFEINKSHPANDILYERGLEIRDNILLRRELSKDGRSRAFVNDQPVTIGFLSELGTLLVEIHGQNEKIGLIDPSTHLSILDQFGEYKEILSDVSKSFYAYEKINNIYLEAAKLESDKKSREEEITNSYDFLQKLNPINNEEQILSTRRNLMMQSEKISKEISEIKKLFLDENDNILGRLGNAQKKLEALFYKTQTTDSIKSLSGALERLLIESKEAENLLEKAISEITYDPKELEKIEERLFALRAAARRFGVNPESLIELKDNFENEIKVFKETGKTLELLNDKKVKAKNLLIHKVDNLSLQRNKWSNILTEKINNELFPLKLSSAEVKVYLEKKNFNDWNSKGAEKARFLVKMNKGSAEGELHKISSGGELSRLMLAINLVLVKSMSDTTLVFDEVDSGVGGAVADAIGTRLESVSLHQQVLVVTHLPQVAALGSQHLKAIKAEKSGITITSVTELNKDERREEVARMLSGKDVTDEARAAANSLIRREANKV